MQFYWFLHFIVPLLYMVGILAMAGLQRRRRSPRSTRKTPGSASQRTDLTGREIIFAKLLGALGRGRRLAEVIILLAAVGGVAGSLDFLSIPLLDRRSGDLWLVRGRTRHLDLAASSLDLARPVLDHRLLDLVQCHRTRSRQPYFQVWLRSPGLAGIHPLRDRKLVVQPSFVQRLTRCLMAPFWHPGQSTMAYRG